MKPSDEKRKFPRFRYVKDIRAGAPGENCTLAGTVQDLSLGGCLLRFRVPSDLEKGGELEICFTSADTAFRATGQVRRHADKGRTLGISFTDLSQRGRRELKALIDALEELHTEAVEQLQTHVLEKLQADLESSGPRTDVSPDTLR